MGLASPALPFPFGGRCEGRQGPGPRMAAGARPSVLRRKEASSCSCVRVACAVVDVGGQGPLRAWLVHNGAAGQVPGVKQKRKQAQERQQRLLSTCDCDRASICDCDRDRDPDRKCPTARPTDSMHLLPLASGDVVAISTQELEVHPASDMRGGWDAGGCRCRAAGRRGEPRPLRRHRRGEMGGSAASPSRGRINMGDRVLDDEVKDSPDTPGASGGASGDRGCDAGDAVDEVGLTHEQKQNKRRKLMHEARRTPFPDH